MTFYIFIKRFVDEGADDPRSRLANTIVKDTAFPKQSDDFEEISDYLEKSSLYSKLLSHFDQAWQDYQYHS